MILSGPPQIRIDTMSEPDEQENIVCGTGLDKLKWKQVAIPDSDQTAYLARLKRGTGFDRWSDARAIVESTHRWPLVVEGHSYEVGFHSLERNVVENVLSRYPFEDPETDEDPGAAGILATAQSIDVDAVFERLANGSEEYDETAWILDEVEKQLDRRPEASELDTSILPTSHRIDRWAYEQQLAADMAPDPLEARQQWYEPQKPVLLLLPVENGWDTLAYVSWYGATDGSVNSAEMIAIGRRWERDFGAELAMNYGTILQCVVSRRPVEPMVAWQLAAQQDLIAPSTLAAPGLSPRQHAQNLLNTDRWFLHERP